MANEPKKTELSDEESSTMFRAVLWARPSPPSPTDVGVSIWGFKSRPQPDKTKPGFTEPPEPIKIGH